MKFDLSNASIIVVVAGQAGKALPENPELAIPPVSPRQNTAWLLRVSRRGGQVLGTADIMPRRPSPTIGRPTQSNPPVLHNL